MIIMMTNTSGSATAADGGSLALELSARTDLIVSIELVISTYALCVYVHVCNV